MAFEKRFVRAATWACGLTVMAISVTVPAGPAKAQAYTYSATIGAGALLSDPVASAVDIAQGRLLVADRNNDAVLVYDTTTLAHIATIGVVGVAVPLDNIHLNQPSGVCVDAANDHILVVDGGNERVQIYDAKSLAYVATIGEPNVVGIDNAHFNRPASVKINPVAGQIYVADSFNERIQIFDAKSFRYVATLGTTRVPGTDANQLIQPSDAEYNPLTNQIMIADRLNERVMLYDATTLKPLSQLGETGIPAYEAGDNAHFYAPTAIAFDAANKVVLIVDSGNHRVQIYHAQNYKFFRTLGKAGEDGTDNKHFATPKGVSADPAHSRIFVVDSGNSRVQVYTTKPAR
ncbi:NHL repeat-containing protein [Bradyrhizobium lablabi]|nr:NHL repeat-containing protein [Bradyrhizobium lablabi]